MTRFTPFLALALTACGVSGSTPVADLNEAQALKICEDAAQGGPEPGEYTCGGGVTFTIDEPDDASIQECAVQLPALGASCPELVVDDYVGCFEAQVGGDPCASEQPPECDAFFTCLFGE